MVLMDMEVGGKDARVVQIIQFTDITTQLHVSWEGGQGSPVIQGLSLLTGEIHATR